MTLSSARFVLATLLALAAGGAAAQQTVPAPTPVPGGSLEGLFPPSQTPGLQPIQIATSHAEAAREMLVASRAADVFQQILPNVMRQISQTVTATNIAITADPARRAALEESIRTVEARFENERDQLLAGIALLYAARFTEAELRQLTEFFRSPAGQKYVTVTPLIAQESIRSASEWANRVGQQAFQGVREEMRRRGHSLN